ncbi:MAG TPA: LysR family transcriptional regulator [Ramlibacter sp.]|nr:LysR family transcriptional regulator [Ramlibacter sp.]
MSLSIRHLRYFAAAAELGRISAAAVQLNISQSAITTAIRDLEALLEQQLFDRESRGVELTDAGRRFLSHAYTVLSAVDDALRMPSKDESVEGTLSIAATYTVLGYFLPHHLQRFGQRHPKVELKVHELPREALEDSLVAGSYQMGVVLTSNVTNHEIATETFFGSERRLWVSSKHPLLDRAEVTLADVANHPYIMLTVDEADLTTLKYWRKTPHQPGISLRTSSVEAVRSIVANGLGVSILSDMVYRPWSLEGRRIETINLKDAIPPMNVGLAWKATAKHTPAMSAFRDYFRQLYMEPSVSRAGRSRI